MLTIVNKYEMLRFRICASALGTCSSYMRWHSFRSYQPGNSLKEQSTWPCYSSSVKLIERKHLKNRHPFLAFKFLVKLPLFLASQHGAAAGVVLAALVFIISCQPPGSSNQAFWRISPYLYYLFQGFSITRSIAQIIHQSFIRQRSVVSTDKQTNKQTINQA